MNKRNITIIGLLFSSVSAILGSGWLFAAEQTSALAGPSSLLSWVIGAVLMMIIAFVFAEICTMIPVTGSSTRIPHITHGTLISFVFAWIIWLSYLTLAPTEVQAVLQYLAVFFPSLIDASTSGLTAIGMFWAAALLLAISILNTYSLRWLIKANNFLTVFKIIIPIVIGVVVIAMVFSNIHAQQVATVAPHGVESLKFAPQGMHGVLAAISMGGIAFSFTGFKLAAELAGETKNPKKAIPIAIIGSILICVSIFLLLQVAYLTVMAPVVHNNDWATATLATSGIKTNFGPFAEIARALSIDWLMVIIYAGAIIGPLAAGLVYFGSATRSIYAMSNNGYLPTIFKKLTPTGSPVFCIAVNFVVGICMFAPLPGWSTMATFLTSLVALTYIMGPISAYTFRYRFKDMERPFKLPFGRAWCIVAFYASTLIVFWSGWEIVSKTSFMIAIAIVVLALYRHFRKDKSKAIDWDFAQSIWFWCYLAAVTLVSYLGSYGGGLGYLDLYSAMAILFVICLIANVLAVKLSLSSEKIRQNLNDLSKENPGMRFRTVEHN